MATAVEHLTTRRDAAALELAAIESRPNFTADAINVDREAHKKALLDEIEQLNKLIILMTGPAVEVTYGF